LDHKLFGANQSYLAHLSRDVGLQWANLEIAVNGTVVWRRHVEVLVGTCRQLEVFIDGDNSVSANAGKFEWRFS